jgi:NADH-quinone oxidoreductase subunit J
MLLNGQEKEGRMEGSRILVQLGAILVVGFLFILIARLTTVDPALVQAGGADLFGTVRGVAMVLFTDFLLPFEIASILLLAAIVGAVILAKRRIDE